MTISPPAPLFGGHTPPRDTSDPARVADTDLVDLLGAYQFLQAENANIASLLVTALGISQKELRVILFLVRHTTATPGDIASDVEMSSGAVTALLDRLEQAGYVSRHPHPTDRRSRVLRLTDHGRDAVTRVHHVYRDAFTGLFTGTDLRDVAEILRVLGRALNTQTGHPLVQP